MTGTKRNRLYRLLGIGVPCIYAGILSILTFPLTGLLGPEVLHLERPVLESA